jgi:hypothetical protein
MYVLFHSSIREEKKKTTKQRFTHQFMQQIFILKKKAIFACLIMCFDLLEA